MYCTVQSMSIYLHIIPRKCKTQTVLQRCISFSIEAKKIRPAFKYFNTIRILEQMSLNLMLFEDSHSEFSTH